MVLNLVALWKQEARRPQATWDSGGPRQPSAESFRSFLSGGAASRLLVAVGLGGAGFNMQDILLEPYGGEVLHLSISATTSLTGLMAGGTLPACSSRRAGCRAVAIPISSPRWDRSSASAVFRR